MKIDSSTIPMIIRLKEIENKVELEIKSISDVQINELKKQYGDTLIITLNPELDSPVLEKARDTDWNSLGAGISILTARGNPCTAAGVAYKGDNYFLMTAGHCMSSYDEGIVGESGGTEKQYSSVLGVDHLNSFASGYDFGLIRITDSSPITRNASNGYLKGNLSLSGYDATLKGDTAGFAVNDTVCHSGYATNFSCGKVTSTKMTSYPDGEPVITAEVQSQSDLSRGGDSGGPWVDVNNNLIGIHSGAPSGTSFHSYFTRWIDVSSRYGLFLYTSSTPTTIVRK